MILKLAYKEVKIHFKLYLIILIQLIITFLVCICFVSVVDSQLRYFWGFRDSFNKEGLLIQGAGFLNPNQTFIQSSTDLEGHLKSADALCCYDTRNRYVKEEQSLSLRTRAYDYEIIKNFQPEIEEGRWLKKADISSDRIEAVISQNPLGLKVGDTILMYELSDEKDDEPLQVEIVGGLKNGTSIFGVSASGAQDLDYRILYENYYIEYEKEPILLMMKEDIDSSMNVVGNHTIAMPIMGSTLITYDNTITEEERQSNVSFLKQCEGIFTMENLSTIKANNYTYLFSQCIILFSVLMGLVLLVLMSEINVRVITAKLQVRNYAIFNICGLSNRKCQWINIAGSALLSLFAFFISILGIWVGKNLVLLDSTVITIGPWQLAVCFALMIMDIGLASILPNKIIGKSTINEVLRANH